ncbi:MAG: nicotinate phosphoribosyltransferase, partial [Candidatus Hydrothermarchaeota archaeon]|nr:nicotinate phosphoribosyltransferase [Candidatus Hydrothermarchaeota archaeon]
MGMFHVASADEIKEGRTTDIYFTRAKEVLEKKGIKKRVVAEVITSSLPKGYPWGVLGGIEEVAGLFEGSNVDVYTMPEGSIFHPWEPVVRLEGEYTLFAELETPLLGLLCQASGIATKAARLKKAAGDKSLLSFGVRRMHPAISPMTDRAAYIGGVDGFSGVAAEKLIGKGASGTMPHALIIAVGDQVKAWRLYDEVIDKAVPRIALVDTYYDEKAEAIMAAEAVKGLYGVRLDTPGSRRGDMKRIVEEVRWELDIRGYKDVKILVSGGVDEDDIRELNKVDGFGIGTSISNAKTIDFAMDIIEMEGKPVAKRGKLGGKKEVYRCTA